VAQSYRKIEAVRKAAEILKYLANEKGIVNGSEIAKAVALPMGTVMCHMATLEELGFVARIGDGYKLGMGLALMWARVKSGLEGERDRVERDLQIIEG